MRIPLLSDPCWLKEFCYAAFSTKWLQPDQIGELEHKNFQIDGPLYGSVKSYSEYLRFTCSTNMKQLSLCLCGDGCRPMYVLRILTVSGYNDIIRPFFYKQDRSEPLFNISVNDLLHSNNPFLQPDDDPEYRQIRARAQYADSEFGPRVNSSQIFKRPSFGFDLHFVLARLTCTAKCFKDGMEICGEPMLSHGCAWYLFAKYDGADCDNGDVDFGVELMPEPEHYWSCFDNARCVGTMSVGNFDKEIDVDVTRPKTTKFFSFAKIPLKKLLGSGLDECVAVVAVTVTDKKRPDTKTIAANWRASLGIIQALFLHRFLFRVSLTSSWDCFNAVNAKGLVGKPNIFIFQACRGEEHDPGFVHEVADNWFTCIRKQASPKDHPDPATIQATPPAEPATSSTSTRPSEITLSPLQIQAMAAKAESLPESADILIAYATPLKYVAWRDSKEGSVFIKTICDVFGEHSKSESLEDMLKMVLRKVAENYKARKDREGYKQMPCYECRFRKKFYFFPNVTSE